MRDIYLDTVVVSSPTFASMESPDAESSKLYICICLVLQGCIYVCLSSLCPKAVYMPCVTAAIGGHIPHNHFGGGPKEPLPISMTSRIALPRSIHLVHA